MDKFWSRVNKQGPIPGHRPELGPCWVWLGSLNHAGYGRIMVNGKRQMVHCYSYETLMGKSIPSGLVIDHLCRNRRCINPSHLEPKTRKENILAPGSLSSVAIIKFQKTKTHCPSGHKYTTENTYLNKRGHRHCKVCTRAQSNKSYSKNNKGGH